MALLHNEGQEKAGASQDSLGGKHDQFFGDTRSILCAGMFINHFTQLIKKKPGTAEIGASLKVQKEQSVLNMQGTTIVKHFKYNTMSKISEEVNLRLENRFFLQSKHTFFKK